jgi:hypothetical protein
VIVDPFGLEENCLARVAPKLRDRISAVSSARQNFKSAVASSIWTLFALLFFASFVAYVRPQVNSCAQFFIYDAAFGANHYAQTGLLEYVDIVVICVAHCPARSVTPRLLIVHSIYTTTMTIRPLVELVPLGDFWYEVVIDIPSCGVHYFVVRLALMI